MLIDSAHYVLGRRQHEDVLPLERAAACPRKGSSFVWLRLHEPGRELMREVRERFGLHELAVEDAELAHQRPKLEQYDDFHYIVFRTAHCEPSGRTRARARLERLPQILESGPAAVVWGVLDEVVDDYRPVVEGIESDIEELERAVFAGPDDATQRIYELKEEVGAFYRAVHPLLVFHRRAWI